MKPREITDCRDCAVKPGENHDPGCDVERCPYCGGQRLSCCDESDGPEALPWTGVWPGVEECIEYGFYCRWGPPWIPCDKDHPDAGPDLNRLLTQCKWDRAKKKFVPR